MDIDIFQIVRGEDATAPVPSKQQLSGPTVGTVGPSCWLSAILTNKSIYLPDYNLRDSVTNCFIYLAQHNKYNRRGRSRWLVE